MSIWPAPHRYHKVTNYASRFDVTYLVFFLILLAKPWIQKLMNLYTSPRQNNTLTYLSEHKRWKFLQKRLNTLGEWTGLRTKDTSESDVWWIHRQSCRTYIFGCFAFVTMCASLRGSLDLATRGCSIKRPVMCGLPVSNLRKWSQHIERCSGVYFLCILEPKWKNTTIF